MATKKQDVEKLAGALLQALPRLIRAVQWNRPADALAEMKPLIESARAVAAATPIRQLELLSKELEARSARGKSEIPHGLVRAVEPRRSLAGLYLDAELSIQVGRFVQETRHADALRQFHCNPRNTLLLSGPPRNGKTSLAEAIAKDLELPLLVASPAAMLESHLGESGRNIAKVFDFASTMPCVLFFDEADTWAIRRGSDRDVGEMARTTNTLLQRLDLLPADCIFVAATNRADELDAAFLGRMQLRIEVPLPSREVLLSAALHELRPEITPGVDLSGRAAELVAASPENVARLIQACESLRRSAALQRAGLDLDAS